LKIPKPPKNAEKGKGLKNPEVISESSGGTTMSRESFMKLPWKKQWLHVYSAKKFLNMVDKQIARGEQGYSQAQLKEAIMKIKVVHEGKLKRQEEAMMKKTNRNAMKKMK
jgi:hypothetical protein